jgi:hypothetical protein
MAFDVLHLVFTETSQMLGWMMVFALMAILAAVINMIAGPAAESVSMKLATMIFGALFVICVITSAARGRA